ncbi:type I-G CRISPR-associated protein, Cas3-extension family [Marinactinospora thermotolerans]
MAFGVAVGERLHDDHVHVGHALTSWWRVPGYTGEYLDHRAIRTAADLPTGESTPSGVSGATWLATQALPLLRLTGNGDAPEAVLWQRIGRRRVMRWPVWKHDHDLEAARELLSHPALVEVAGWRSWRCPASGRDAAGSRRRREP